MKIGELLRGGDFVASARSRQRNPPTLLEKEATLVDDALSTPFTSEARALKRNVASGYSCSFLGPARPRNRNRADRFCFPSSSSSSSSRCILRLEEASARIMSFQSSRGDTDKRRIFPGSRCEGLLPFVIQGEGSSNSLGSTRARV